MRLNYFEKKYAVGNTAPGEMKKSTHTRIAIVGAGAAGLSAAEALKQKGYDQVTLFEREERPGGKCKSIEYQGRSYELGAGIVAENNQTVLQLAKKFGVAYGAVEFGQSVLIDHQTGQILPKKPLTNQLLTAHRLLFKYRSLTRRYRDLAEPGFSTAHSDVCIPFSDWANLHDLQLVAKEFAPFFTGFGYGYFANVPAAYVLKYYSWDTIKSFAKRQMYKFPNGIQSLWKAVAKDKTILYNTPIKKIQRDHGVTITTDTATQQFDWLILTSPLDEFLQYGDANQKEKTLFSKILYCDYRTYACVLNGFPNVSGYVPGNYQASRAGHPVFWYQRYPDSNLYTFYVLGDWKITDEQAIENIQRVVEQLGGKLERVHTTAHWKYFPHVGSEDMQGGFYHQLENLQGQQATYYAGELLNFSTVGSSAAYAENLVERFF